MKVGGGGRRGSRNSGIGGMWLDGRMMRMKE